MIDTDWLRRHGYPEECPECGSDLELHSEKWTKGVKCAKCEWQNIEGI